MPDILAHLRQQRIPFRMAETPKKLVESGSKCFTCSSLCTVNEKIFIFGKNAANFTEIIQSAANININCSDNSGLFICKRVCHIISRAADHLQEVKQEIEETFKAREKPRAKRLLRSEDGKPDEALLLVSPGNP